MPKLLAVEDNELNRDLLARRLVRRSCAVTLAQLDPLLPAAPAP